MVNVKHFGNNEQETNRNSWSANPDTITEMEIYMKPFLAAIDAGAGSLMCAYNKVQGVHACKNKALMQAAKRRGDAFFIVSDWGAVYPDAANGGIVDYIEAGLDVEMGTHDTPGCDGHASPDSPDYCNKGDYMLADKMHDLVSQGKVSEGRVNETVSRVLGALKTAGLLDPAVQAEFPTYTHMDLHSKFNGPLMKKDARTQHSRAVAHKVARKAMVLLQNVGSLLPLKTTEKLELYGCGDEVHFRAEAGSAAGTMPFTPANPCQADDETACMYPNDAVVAAGATVDHFKLDEAKSGPRDPSAVAVICVTAASKNSEGTDRSTLALLGSDIPWEQFQRSIVWVVSPGPVLIPFAPKVSSILYSALPGEMGGAAFADILFGKASPSGHLSLTLPNKADETSVRVHRDSDDYAEGVEVGYRWYQANGKHANFAFGWGLSYATHLELTAATLTPPAGSSRARVDVALRWRNADGRFGSVDQVVQLFVQHQGPTARNFKQLVGFAKVAELQDGEAHSASVEFEAPATWGSAPGDRDGFNANWQEVTQYALFVSLFGIEDTRALFTVDLTGGMFVAVPEHNFSRSPISFDQDAVVEMRNKARERAQTGNQIYV
jgi:beta-glucosidase